MKYRFKGVMPALLTPYDADGCVNKETVRRLVSWQLERGAMGFYVCGSTGEGPVISASVRKAMLEEVLGTVQGRVPVIAHVGSINCDEGIELARHAEAAGANGVSSVPPNFYFEYKEQEIVDYYTRLAESTSLPFILYAVPRMANIDINSMLADLLKVPNIVGLKDTRAQYFNMWKLRQLNGGDINIINGPDEMLICGLTMGADGGIGSTYNIMPDWFANLYNQFVAGNFAAAQEQQNKINKVIEILLRWGCLRSLKTYLTAKGFPMGPTVFPQRQLTCEEASLMIAEIDAVLPEDR